MRLLLLTPPGSGQINPFLALAQELRQAGHELVWSVPRRGVARAQRAGVPVIATAPHDLDFEARDEYAPGHSQQRGWREFCFTAQRLIIQPAKAVVDDLLRLEQPRFDAIVYDVASAAGSILASMWGIPAICVCTTSWCDACPDVPPYGFEAELEAGRSIDEWSAGHAAIRDGLNELRASFGLKPLSRGWDDLFSPLLTIAVTAPELEYPRPRGFPPNVLFVGAMNGLRAAPARQAEARAWVERFAPHGFVYMTMGTVFNKYSGCMERLLSAALAMDRPVLLSTGPGWVPEPELVAALPERLRLDAWVDHAAVMPLAQAVVCHGGMGTINDTIGAGVPSVTLPVGCDLPSLARKLCRSNASIMLDVDSFTTAQLVAAVERVCRAPHYRAGVAILRDAYVRQGGAATAARAIEQAVVAWGHRSGSDDELAAGDRLPRQVSN